MKIGGWQKVSLIDYPGLIATVFFVTGCNFRCPFCFNQDLVLGKPLLIKPALIFAFLKKRKKVLDGVVITGGEPTLQADLAGFIRKIRQLGYKVKLDTNGAKPQVLQGLLKKKLVNYVAMDFKSSLAGYEKTTAGKIKNLTAKIEQSLQILAQSGVPFELRTTVVPGIHDQKTLIEMARHIQKLAIYNPQPINWFIQNFQPKNCLDPKFKKRKSFSEIELQQLYRAAREVFIGTKLRS